MKNHKMLKAMIAVSLAAALCVAAFAADAADAPVANAASEHMVNDAVASQSLFTALNTARGAAGLEAMSYDNGLEKIALAYAEALALADSSFRQTTDYLTLPSGARVFSLVAATGYGPVQNFYYYVWQNPARGSTTMSQTAFVEATDLFKLTVVNGNYKNVGVAAATDRNGTYSAVIMVFCNPLTLPTPAPAPAATTPAAPSATTTPAPPQATGT